MNLMESLEADFDSIRTIRDNLSGESRALNDISTIVLPEHMAGLRSFWKEESTEAFVAKEMRLIDEMTNEIAQLSRIASSINSMAEGLYRAEFLNTRLGGMRGY